MLDQASELSGVALAEFAGGGGFVEEFLRLLADDAELRESDGVEVGVGQVDLEIGETIGHGIGRGGEGGAVHVQFDEGLERRGVLGAGGCEFLRDGGRSGAAHGEEQAALGAEALDECRGNHAGFLGNVGEGELGGAAALHDAGGGGKDLFVGGFARARAHVLVLFLRRGSAQEAATARTIITE